ncbi:MAG: chitobiase/beta-hexosaminidase C-terminal domain-containing protein, partial [Verrucomicrobiae bacterium]|nr:chitobiase/beta-hexosaminidase C-terminal domain-containing protein [Verrucomicrobiae bacterium]
VPSAEVTIRISTSPKLPGELASNYESNHGVDVQVVFSGTRTFDAGLIGGEFTAWFPFDVPFLYDPAAGNLLVEVVTRSSSGIDYTDASNDLDDKSSRAFGYNPDGTSAQFRDTGADILALEFDAAFPLVVPAGFDLVEDDGWSGTLAVLLRMQEVYGAVSFPNLPMVLNGLAFRRDADTPSFEDGVALLTMRLSTTATAPDAMSATFAENYGNNVVTVYSGAIQLASPTESQPGSPAPFEIAVPFSAPYNYDPADGNLLVEIIVRSAAGIGWNDQSNELDDHASRAFSLSPDATQATYRDSGADVLRFDYTPAGPLLRISPAGGWREGPVLVTISSWQTGGVIRYTLDGSEPTATSPLYEHPLNLEGSTIFRAAAFAGDQPVTEVVGETYVNSRQPLMLGGVAGLDGKQVTLGLDGWEGFSFEVLATTSYRTWTSHGVRVNHGGRITFEDPLANVVAARFYQLRMVEP